MEIFPAFELKTLFKQNKKFSLALGYYFDLFSLLTIVLIDI